MAPLSRAKGVALSVCLAAAIGTPAPAASAKPTLAAGAGHKQAGVFTAGPEGAEFAVCGDGRLRLEPGTEVRLFAVSQRLALVGNRSATTWSVLLRKGRVDVELRASAKHGRARCALLVSAPRKLAMLVLEGRAASIARDDHVTVANLGGDVLSSSGDGFRPLSSWHRRTISGQGFSDAIPLLSAPASLHGRRVYAAIGKPAEVRWMSWPPVAGAAGYRVELSTRGNERAIAALETQETTLRDGLGNLAPGIYELGVRPIDALGVEGQATTTSLQVIGAELPPGAFLDEKGVIRLGKGQTVSFSHADGLQMMHGKSSHSVDASTRVGLLRNAPTVVHFRTPGALQGVLARLAPRGIRARVFAGPKTARWPSDPITLSVRLEDERGRPLPDWIEAHPRVMVGIEPIEVTWQREGRTLRAIVPPQSTPGPWVVRVDVEDQFGLPIGRDFVEIVAGGPAKKPAQIARINPR